MVLECLPTDYLQIVKEEEVHFNNGKTDNPLPEPSDQSKHPVIATQPRLMNLIASNMKYTASLKHLNLCLYHSLEEDNSYYTMKKQLDKVSMWEIL